MIDRDTEWWVRSYRAVAWWCRTLAFILAAVVWYRGDSVETALFGLIALFSLLWVGADLQNLALRGEMEIVREEEGES